MNYIHHVTLNTGHSRRSTAGEIGADAISACQASLAICLIGPGQRAKLAADLTGDMLAYDITAAAAGHSLIATVWRGDKPICTIGVAARGRGGPQLWRGLHEHAASELRTSIDVWPQAPWCAARLDPGLAWHADAAHWLGDYERCLAWAWISMRKAEASHAG